MDKKIKSVKSIHVDYAMENPSNPAETEWIEKETYTASLNEFDPQGDILKASSYNHDQEIHEFYEYKYNENHKVVEELCYFDEDQVAEHKFIEWDENGLAVSEKIIYQEDGSETTSYFTYNEAKQVIEKRILDQDDELEELDKFEYDGDKLISESKFDCDMKLVYTNKYKFDEKGNMIEYEHSSSDPYEFLRHEYFYNEQGEREKVLKYNYKNMLVEKNIMEFDEQGNLIELFEETQTTKKTTKLYYDDNGNQIKQEEFNEDDEIIISIDRTYDADNQMLESLVFAQNPDDGVQQMYAYRYEYEYWE